MSPLSTAYLTAGQVMDRCASLMNDTAKTDYTYVAQLPYLNMAIDELQEQLQLHSMSPTTQTTENFIIVTAGQNKITHSESPILPHYPFDLVEIISLSERLSGTEDSFVLMERKELLNIENAGNSLSKWTWINQEIRFIEAGATTDREIKIDYVRQPIQLALNENSPIGVIGVRSYLAYKTASFCATFIGENPGRGKELEGLATEALDRLLGIGAKGRQSISTRRRPFRAGYKSLGWLS